MSSNNVTTRSGYWAIGFKFVEGCEDKYMSGATRPTGKVFYTELGAKRHYASLVSKYGAKDKDGNRIWKIEPFIQEIFI